MKKIINAIKIIIDFVIDSLFLSRLMFEINYHKKDKELTYNHLRVLLQFTGNSFDNSAFEFYNLNKEDSFYTFYLSLKKHKSRVFQTFCFFHCLFFNHLLYNLFWAILPNNKIGVKIRLKIINRVWGDINEFLFFYLKNDYTIKKLYREIKTKTKWFVRDLFIVKLVWVTCFLIKNKGHFEIDMQEPSFNDEYYVDNDNEDNYIKTSFRDIIEDIYYCCND